MLTAFLCGLAAVIAPAAPATPFEDIHHRFHLELPAGWQFAPQPGDNGGAAFRRTVDGAFLNGMVRVMPFTDDVELTAFVERIVAASTSEPGYREQFAERCRVAGYTGHCRRYIALVNGDPHLAKMAEQRLVVHNRVGYVVHVEALAEAFVGYERDVQALLRSFALGPTPKASAPRRHPHMSDLNGAFRSRSGAHTLELTPGGTLVLDGNAGTYRVDQGTLVATFAQDTQVFGLDFAGDALVLSGGPFGEGESFLRGKTAAGAEKGEANDTKRAAPARAPKGRSAGTKARQSGRGAH